MSTFEVKVERVLDIQKHPNADRLALVTIRGYHCVSANLEDGSFRYRPGDLVVYVPEGALVPEYLLKEHGFWDEKKNQGVLSGTHRNRVKAIKLRGELSQGIIFSVSRLLDCDEDDMPYYITNSVIDADLVVQEGDDVASFLGITKYEPPIPTNMAGKIYSIGGERTFKYDINNIKERPRAFDGKDVVFTEKLHGTQCVIGHIPGMEDNGKLFDGCFISSKGMFAKGLVLDNTEDNRQNNLYVRTIIETGILEKFKRMSDTTSRPMYLFGEIIGRGVQDLWYGEQSPVFRAFDLFSAHIEGDITLGTDDSGGRYPFDYDFFKGMCASYEIPVVPELYIGLFSDEVMMQYTKGMTTFNGFNIREGIVIKPLNEERWKNGRLIAKSVSEEYLLRKGDTTEFE